MRRKPGYETKGTLVKTVSNVMSHLVNAVSPDDPIQEVCDVMLDERIHALPVVDSDGHPVGIVTTFDLLEDCAPDQTVETVMCYPTHTVAASMTVADAARFMLDHSIHHLPVTEDGTIVGMVSSFDLLRAIAADRGASPGPTPRG